MQQRNTRKNLPSSKFSVTVLGTWCITKQKARTRIKRPHLNSLLYYLEKKIQKSNAAKNVKM